MLRTLHEADLEAYLRLVDHAWGYPNDEATRVAALARLSVAIGAFDASGALLASASARHGEAFVARRRVPLLGMAAVMTVPTARRNGLASRLLARLLSDGHEAGTGWSLLYPYDPRYYARLGWQSLPTGVRLSLSTRWWSAPEPVEAEQIAGDLRAALHDIHQRCAACWNFADARTRGLRDPWEHLQPEPGQREAAFVTEDGYAIVRLEERARQLLTLRVVDTAWCSAAGRRNVLALLGSYQGQVQRIELEIPRDDPLAWDWSDWWTAATNDTRMVRVVDLRRALGDIGSSTDLPEASIRVRDPFAPWNDGTWRIAPGADGCDVTAATHAAQTTLDVRALPLLLGGAATPAAVVRAGLAEGDQTALDVLAALAGGLTPYRAPADRF